MALLHQHGCSGHYCCVVVSILFVVLVLTANLTLATPRFEPAAPGLGHGHGQRDDIQRKSQGLARVEGGSSSSVAPPPNEPRSSSSVNKHVPEALKRFNFNARKADFARTPSSDSEVDSVDWTYSHYAEEDAATQNENENELADIALVVTVDGSIHAIKRDTGTWVWSLHDENKHEQRQEIVQTPLVRSSMRNSSSSSQSITSSSPRNGNTTLSKEQEYDEEQDEDDEIYIIEPHSAGDIYVYSKSTSKVQRLPLSLTQLVELSPFTFPVRGGRGSDGDGGIDTDNKLFVGRKESKLVGVDLQSGKLVGVFGPEAGWCEWPQTPTRAGRTEGEGGRSTRSSPGSSGIPEDDAIENRPRDLLYLGQTDYHLSIYSKTQGLLQTLSYTSYGPSSLGGHTSSSHLENLATSAEEAENQPSQDGRYIQPMHDGSLICLNPEKEGIQWTNKFSQPVVGVFDIWYPAARDGDTSSSQPILAIHPHHRIQNQLEELANIPPSTFIGKLDKVPSSPASAAASSGNKGEYYAMSNYHFPLVSFAPSSASISASDSGSASSSNTDESAQNGAARSSQHSIVGSHWIDEPINSGRTIGAPSTPLTIDPSDAPAGQLPAGNNGSAWNRPLLPPTNHEAGYGEAMWRYMSLGGLEPHVTLLDAIAVLGGILILTFAFMRKKMSAGRMRKRNGGELPLKREEEQPPNLQGESTSTSATSVSIVDANTSEGTSRSSSSGIVVLEGTQPRRMPSHASSRSLDKALPALPLEEPSKAEDAAQSEDEDANEGDENGVGGGAEQTKNPKKGRRRKRGGKRNAVRLANGLAMEEKEQSSPEMSMKEELKEEPKTVVVDSAPPVVAKDESSSGKIGNLEISENVLGYGSHGTVVLKGTFQGRAVAVKRLLKDFVRVASHEVSLLQESDDHPNVIRYFCKESHSNFHYIALELCPTSLYELIDTPQAFPTIIDKFDANKALKQMTRGLAHLHKLKIIHRDLKPQNILVTTSPGKKPGDGPVVRLVISDFGLCKKLDLDESSFLQSTRGGGSHAAGSFGYRAPEVLRGEVDANDLVNEDSSNNSGENGRENSLGSKSASTSSTATLAPGGEGSRNGGGRKLTRAIDIFSLGCIFYFVLTMGEHPFGSRYEREINILNDKIGLGGLSVMTEGRHEAEELIRHMCASDPRVRPTANDILLDPLFWSASHSLHFLCDASDRFEIMEREHFVLGALEAEAPEIVGKDWLKSLDRNLIDNLGKYRKYDGGSVRDLLRVMRNKKHHYQDLPENVRRSLGEPPAGFLSYFTKRFPKLLLHVHSIVKQFLAAERMFGAYFEHDDT